MPNRASRDTVDPEKVFAAAQIAIARYGTNAVEAVRKMALTSSRPKFTAAVIAEIIRLTETTHH